MPGRKKGRQRGNARSKAQRHWNNDVREAIDSYETGRRAKVKRSDHSAPPSLCIQGYRSLSALLLQRARADRAEEVATLRPFPNATVAQEGVRSARQAYTSTPERLTKPKSGSIVDLSERRRPRRPRSLMSFCVTQIGKDFVDYHSEDDNIASTFSLLPDACLSQISRAASARGTIRDHNIALLCSPGVTSLCLRGRFSDQGIAEIYPGVRVTNDQDIDQSTRQRDGANPPTEHQATEGEQITADISAASQDTSGTGPSGMRGECSSAEGVVDRGVAAISDDEEEWETAADRLQISLSGCASLTALEVSSPLISSSFFRRLPVHIPFLRRLGLQGSLDVAGVSYAICDCVPRLTSLRELDVSLCSWFCDLCLRRFTNTLARRSSSPHYAGRPTPQHMSVQYMDETSDWGAAAAGDLAMDNTMPSSGGCSDFSIPRTPQLVGVEVSGESIGGKARRELSSIKAAQVYPCTVICAHTAVTENGARNAEAIVRGLRVLFEKS